MTTEKKRGRPVGSTGKSGPRPGSRRWIMDNLKVGEDAFFMGDPGSSAGKLMAIIASYYKAGEPAMKEQGLTQSGGIAIFDGEISRAVVKVTRFKKKP